MPEIRTERSGLMIIDKPAGMTSAQVVAIVKRGLKAQKVGHTGTLDPFATGVLPCPVNDGTKLARFFLDSGKTYEAVLRLGIHTDTQDATGKIVSKAPIPALTDTTIHSVFGRFEGENWQVPPVYSALKHKGIPLYEYARQGNPVQKPARRITIDTLCIKEICLPDIRFLVKCSSGTYIRTLCADIGKKIGCGGFLKALKRTESSGFSIGEAIALEEFRDPATSRDQWKRLISMTDALRNMPEYEADDHLTEKIRHGKPLTETDLPMKPITYDGAERYLKIIDSGRTLLAVVTTIPKEQNYRYCRVFIN